MDYETAVDLLKSPEIWCQGAEALAQLGDSRAVLPLMRAYETRQEGGKACLLDALEALGGSRTAGALFAASASPDEQRLAVHLMELFPREDHLAHLEQAAASRDSELQYQAGRALVCQPQSDAWEEVMRNLLQSNGERLRSWAIEGLGHCRRESAREALRNHLSHESSVTLQTKLAKMLAA